MDTMLFIQLGLLFFLEFAIYGAWCPVLAARLLGPLKMSGKQAGWIYATLPLATMVSPLVVGHFADNNVDPKWLMVVCHVLGGVFLVLAAKQQKFWPLFAVMFLYSLLFGPTLALANTIVFAHAGENAPQIFIWAPIAWAAIGYALSGWRSTRKTEGDGSDCLWLAAGLSLLMAVVCAFQPDTAPKGGAGMIEALSMLKSPMFLVFVVAQFIGAAVMQFYFLGTAPFMQDKGIQNKYVPGAMAIAQVAQAVATYFFLGWLYYQTVGATGTIAIGAGCWLALFVVYIVLPNKGAIAASQAFHGLAYVFFINASWMFVDDYADESIRASAQSLITMVQIGVGMFLGTQIAGVVMDKNSVEGKFHWKKIFVVPVACMAVAVVLLLGFVKNPEKKVSPEKSEPAAQEAAMLSAPSQQGTSSVWST